MLEKAKKAGGLCEAPRPNRPDNPPIEPTKIFDDVYVIGNQGTVAYVINTSDGLLILDSLQANQTETQLLPGFQKLGLEATVMGITSGELLIFMSTTVRKSTFQLPIGI